MAVFLTVGLTEFNSHSVLSLMVLPIHRQMILVQFWVILLDWPPSSCSRWVWGR